LQNHIGADLTDEDVDERELDAAITASQQHRSSDWTTDMTAVDGSQEPVLTYDSEEEEEEQEPNRGEAKDTTLDILKDVFFGIGQEEEDVVNDDDSSDILFAERSLEDGELGISSSMELEHEVLQQDGNEDMPCSPYSAIPLSPILSIDDDDEAFAKSQEYMTDPYRYSSLSPITYYGDTSSQGSSMRYSVSGGGASSFRLGEEEPGQECDDVLDILADDD